MVKRHRIIVSTVAILVLLLVAIILFVATFNWNRIKPWVEAHASTASGRKIEITGNLDAAWHWRRRANGEDTWSPGLGFIVGGVRVGNPGWAKKPHFASVESLRLDLRLLPLLWHHVDIPSVSLIQPSLDFERRKDGSNTWTFGPTDKSANSTWDLRVGRIEFGASDVTIADARRDLDIEAEITPLESPIAFGKHVEGDDFSTRHEVIQRVGRDTARRLHEAAKRREEKHPHRRPPPYLFAWTAHGTMEGSPVKGTGRVGGVLTMASSQPFPLRADFSVGDTEIALSGTITDLSSPNAVDMRLWISGQNLAQLYPIVGINLPNSRPFATVGRLTGRFHPERSLLRYQDFTARVGGSDLSGSLTYRSGAKRPSLTGHVDSTLLQLSDLGTLVGAAPDLNRAQHDGESPDANARVLPVEPFDAQRWDAMDADVKFTGKRVFRDKELPIDNVQTQIRMTQGVLTLDPLRFGMAGGHVTSSLRIDSKATPPNGSVSLDLRKLQLRRLFEKVDGLSGSLGAINGEVKLDGSGRSIASILGASDGSAKLVMTDGQVSRTLMEKAGLNIANMLISKAQGDQLVDIACAAADFNVKDGAAKADLFVFDTKDTLIDIDGTINLRNERIDLTLHPETKGVRVISLRSPLHVTGTFRHVDVSVDKKSLIARAAGAIALGVVAAPLAALAPLIAPGDSDDAQSCAPLVAELKKKRTSHPAAKAKQEAPRDHHKHRAKPGAKT